ncbi:MAG TPA: hypothetical protein VGW38_19960 [Chloroflexota bacterium]|nr:hypothetical protein [Chloroflexota bacterium]
MTAVLEVILGIAFLFAILSLVASAVNELIAAAFGLRARTLKKGISNLLASPTEAQALYEHPLIQSLYRSGRRPSYIPRDKFALALLDAKVKPAVNAVGEGLAQVGKTIEELPPGQVKDTLDLLWRDAGNSVERFRRNVEGWFDDSMERVSGWYRRQTQAILLAVALFTAVGLNVNAITVTQRLWSDGPLRSAVIEQARSAAPPPAEDARAVQDALQNVERGLNAIGELSLPIGWSDDARPSTWYVALAGWLVSAMAISMGAPFWFDLLGRVSRLRSTGVRPPTSLPPSAEAQPTP